MDLIEAISCLRIGNNISRDSWSGMAFLRAEYCANLQVNEEIIPKLKTEIFLSVFDERALELRYIFQYFAGRRQLYFFDKCDLVAKDWNIYKGFKND